MALVLYVGIFRIQVSYNEPGREGHLNRMYRLAIYEHIEIIE